MTDTSHRLPRWPAPFVKGLLAASLAAATTCAAAQSPGTLDPGFGVGGRVLTDAGAANDRLHALLTLDDGSVVALGQTTRVHPAGGSTVDAVLVRYRADGLVDGSFGSGGFAGVDSSRTSDIGYALARLADGSLLAAGKFGDGGPAYSNFGVAKLSANGQLDTGFGLGGIAHINLAPSTGWNDNATAVAVQSTGKIVLGGVAYAVDGTPDAGFGDGQGRATVSMSAQADRVAGIAVSPSGAIVVAGYAQIGGGGLAEDFALARFFGDADRIFANGFQPP